MSGTELRPGDPIPWFVQRSTSRDDYHIDTVAGRYFVLCFFGSMSRPGTSRMFEDLWRHGDAFDDVRAACYGVSCDPRDEAEARIGARLPGFRVIWDGDLKVARQFGLVDSQKVRGRLQHVVRSRTFVVGPDLRILAVLPLGAPEGHAAEILRTVSSLPPPAQLLTGHPPVLVVPNVFEPEFCRELIAGYERHGGTDSGFVREVDGRTVEVVDYRIKRRRDWLVEDAALRDAINDRVAQRINPELEKAFCFRSTRIERHIVARYDAGEGGYFLPHRDNTTRGTAHRRFAVTINLDATGYEGGDLRFPEYDVRAHRAPTGGAIVFSCSLMHEVTPMTSGKRYAFLPFLYDDAAAAVRLANVDAIADDELRAAVLRSTRPPRDPKDAAGMASGG